MYDLNVGLARVITKALKDQGFEVKRAISSGSLRVATHDHGLIVIECKKNDDQGEDVYVFVPTFNEWLDRTASKLLKNHIVRLLRKTGLSVGV